MSDASNAGRMVRKNLSLINPLFAQAVDMVFDEEGNEKPVESGTQAPAGGTGAQVPAPEGEGAGGEGPAAAAQAGRDGAGSANPLTAAQQPATPPTGTELRTGAAEQQQSAPDPQVNAGDTGQQRVGFPAKDAVPLFAQASEKILQNMRNSFQKAAEDEVRRDIDPIFITLMEQDPYLIAGETVPDIRPTAKPEDRVRLASTAEAESYQRALKKLFEAEVKDVATRKEDEVRPMLTVLQESALLFQNNPDLIEGTDAFDPELATRFAQMGKAYEVKINGKVTGYQVNMQPILNSIREQLTKERTTNNIGQQQMNARQQQAAAQARDDQGRFDGPQAGIVSKSNVAGSQPANDDEDMSAFWAGTRFKVDPTLNL